MEGSLARVARRNGVQEALLMTADLVVAVFPSRRILIKALDHIMQLQDLDYIHAAIVTRARDGEIVVIGDEISADEGGVAGGTLGAGISLLGMVQLGALALPGVGPIIALGAGALVGSLVGGMTGRFASQFIETGLRPEQLEGLSEHLHDRNSALVLEVADARSVLERLRKEFAEFQASFVERLPERRAAHQ
jgi:uncharacterized membrane protein